MKATKTKLTVNFAVFRDEQKTEILTQGVQIFTNQDKCTAWVRKFRKSLTNPTRVQIASA